MKSAGKVYLIGAGPGDPGLITVRGLEILRQADAVIYDRLINPVLLEAAVQAEKIYAGKDQKGKAARESVQNKIHSCLVQFAKRGKTVVRLKGGDPFIFGRGAEEASYLKKHGVAYEIVPGITAGYAVPAYAGIPVTDRRFSSLAIFVTGHENPDKKTQVDWKKLAPLGGTLVAFMSVKNLKNVVRALQAGGKSMRTPAAVMEWGTCANQRVIEGTLATIEKKARAAKLGSPALTVIGEVAKLRHELAWFEKKPLFGKTVLVTRAVSQAGSLRRKLEEQGARVLEYPAIEIKPPADETPFDEALSNLADFEWLVLTSVNGVEAFWERLRRKGKDARALAHLKIAVIGERTKEALSAKGIEPDLMPEQFTTEGLLEAFKKWGYLGGKRFLLARADIAPPVLVEGLEHLGARVTEVEAYRTVAAKQGPDAKRVQRLLFKKKVDYVTLTSSSTVRYFIESLPPAKRKGLQTRWISIGPVTTQTLKTYGYKPFREAKTQTIDGMIKAMAGR